MISIQGFHLEQSIRHRRLSEARSLPEKTIKTHFPARIQTMRNDLIFAFLEGNGGQLPE